MARVIVGGALIALYLALVGASIPELIQRAGRNSNIGEAVLGMGVGALITVVPGSLLVHLGSRRGMPAVFLVPGIVFAVLHWMVVQPMFAGGDSWDTALLMLLNLFVDPLAGAFFAVGLYPLFRLRAIDEFRYARVATLVMAAVTIGVTTTEILVNNRHRGSIAGQLTSPDPAVRIAAAKELAKTGYAEGVPAMSAALRDPVAEVRIWAVRALGKSESLDAAEPLHAAVDDSDPQVRRAAVEALRNLQDKRGLALPKAVLLEALHRGDLVVVAAAADFYVRRGEEGSEDVLVRALEQHGTEETAATLLNCGHPVLRDAARAWAKKHGYDIKTAPGSATVRWGDSQ